MTRRETLDTERMLERVTRLLIDNADPNSGNYVNPREDAESLRRISMTLHRWHELECGDGNDHGSWVIVRGHRKVTGDFVRDDAGDSYLEKHTWVRKAEGDFDRTTYTKIPDREKGALARLAKVMARYPSLKSYVQTDPRGCALYIIRPGDVPEGEDVSAYYSRGVAVRQ